MFAQMFAIGGVAVSVPSVFAGDTLAFGLNYGFVRVTVALMYWRVYREIPASREMARFSGTWFGKGFVKVLTLLSHQPPGLETALLCGLALAITCSIWWIYFDDVAGSRFKPIPWAPYVWVYAHLPLTIAITAVGVAVKKVVDPAFIHLDVLPGKYRWLLCGSVGLAWLCVAVIDSITARRESELGDHTRTTIRAASGVMVLLLAPAGAFLSPMAFLALVAAACVLQVGFDLSMAPLMQDHHDAEHHAQAEFEAAMGRTPTQPDGDEPDPATAVSTRRWDVSDAVRKGTPNALRRDLYFHFMDGPWSRLLIALLASYFFTNLFFAALYMLQPEGIAGMKPGSFLDAFFFSVQTMTTIGYGAMHPQTVYADVLVTIEAALGLLGVALATGLLFAKASRPKTRVLFSKHAVISTRHGVPTLTFRVGNARGNDVIEATMRVAVLVNEVSPEGHQIRRIHDIKLVRANAPVFALSWTLMHQVDESSPLHGWAPEEYGNHLMALICTMTGYDATYAQQVHTRHLYYPENLYVGRRFVDVIDAMPDGRLMIDYAKFHDTTADDSVDA
ncbi:MAG: inward rectifier potassium channel [Myxococcota bacterium]